MIETVLAYMSDKYFMLCYPIALVLSIRKYPLYFNTVLKYLPILIGYALLSELLGLFIRDFESIQIVSVEEYSYANNLVFNIYDIVFFLYFFYVYWKILKIKKHRSLVIYGVFIYLGSCIINPFLQDFTIFAQIYASTTGSFLLVTYIFLYFFECYKGLQRKDDLLLWLSLGLLIFNLFFPFIMIIGEHDYSLYLLLHLRQVHYALITAMYSCIIIGLMRVRYSSEN